MCEYSGASISTSLQVFITFVPISHKLITKPKYKLLNRPTSTTMLYMTDVNMWHGGVICHIWVICEIWVWCDILGWYVTFVGDMWDLEVICDICGRSVTFGVDLWNCGWCYTTCCLILHNWYLTFNAKYINNKCIEGRKKHLVFNHRLYTASIRGIQMYCPVTAPFKEQKYWL